jgi:hypothetical protein
MVCKSRLALQLTIWYTGGMRREQKRDSAERWIIESLGPFGPQAVKNAALPNLAGYQLEGLGQLAIGTDPPATTLRSLNQKSDLTLSRIHSAKLEFELTSDLESTTSA